MKQPQYTEGPEAFQNFERFARTILQAPKPKGKAKKNAATSRKRKKSDKD